MPYDAGLDVLRILATYQSRTSLLQDYAWYEARQANGTGDEKDEKACLNRDVWNDAAQ